MTVQIIAKYRRTELGELATAAFQSTQRGVDLAILLFMAILWPYKFWRQGYDFVAALLNQYRRHYRVRITDFTVAVGFAGTAGAV